MPHFTLHIFRRNQSNLHFSPIGNTHDMFIELSNIINYSDKKTTCCNLLSTYCWAMEAMFSHLLQPIKAMNKSNCRRVSWWPGRAAAAVAAAAALTNDLSVRRLLHRRVKQNLVLVLKAPGWRRWPLPWRACCVQSWTAPAAASWHKPLDHSMPDRRLRYARRLHFDTITLNT